MPKSASALTTSSGALTLRQAISDYQSTEHYKSLRPGTKANSEKAFKKLSPWMDAPLKDLSTAKLLNVLDRLQPGAAHIFATRTGAMLRHNVARGALSETPLKGFRLPKTGEFRPWTKDELKGFLRRTNKPIIKLAIKLAYYTGQRVSDVLKIKWSDINKGVVHIVQQKTGTEVFIPVSKALGRLLLSVDKCGEYVVSREDGSQVSVTAFRQSFSRERKRLGFPPDLHFHGLRKLVACELAEDGATTEQIKAVGGWTNSRQVDHYTKAARRKIMADAVIESLGGLE